MKTLMCAALLITSSISSAWATTPTPESIKRYMIATQTDALMEQTLKQPIDFKAMVAEFEPDPTKQQAFLDSTDLFYQRLNQKIDRQKMIASVEQAVSTTFTQTEIDAAIRFYESSEGQSTLKKMPEFMQKLMQGMMPVLSQAMTQTFTELAEQHATAKP